MFELWQIATITTLLASAAFLFVFAGCLYLEGKNR